MRSLIVACVLVVLAVPSSFAQAGKLSRARTAVRGPQTSSNDDDQQTAPPASSNASSKSSGGKLSQARNEVRRPSAPQPAPAPAPPAADPPPHHSGGGSYHRPPTRSHGGSHFGFFMSSQPCPTPPVRWSHPVHACPPVYTCRPAVTCTPAPVYVVSEPAVVLETPAEPVEYEERIVPEITEHYQWMFTRYPYELPGAGFMANTTADIGSNWFGRAQMEMGSDFDGLDRIGFGLLVEHSSGLGIDFDWDSYSEDLPGGGHDELHLGEFDLLYRVAESERSLVRLGLGTVWLGDSYDTDYGINFTLKADFAPVDPIVLSGELDLGTIGDAEHLHAAGTVGAMIGRCELYGGYDYQRIGDVELAGPLLGLRVWF
ncbi:hypothetical protein [Aeoliella mucimassa]|uniref:Outer membrane protein beta-barrel domain-containing protein n=1 Tax=Aeoliella mucimassa TaxID=2527972 RepID=A0A518AGK1_9BACT|nr:hypothetical protein [Aeoliella mucimassa]QDU53848.1 hypothetical protein Pan181_00260 [Aeoliella mucimassa]